MALNSLKLKQSARNIKNGFTLSCKTFRLRHSVSLSKIADAIFGRSTCLAPSQACSAFQASSAPYGFTLAEVLITLVVLGIVAAVTVPTLRNSLDDKKYRIPLKKTYAVLSEALDETFNFSDYHRDSNVFDFLEVFSEFRKHVAIGKICCKSGTDFTSADCFSNSQVSGVMYIKECFNPR